MNPSATRVLETENTYTEARAELERQPVSNPLLLLGWRADALAGELARFVDQAQILSGGRAGATSNRARLTGA